MNDLDTNLGNARHARLLVTAALACGPATPTTSTAETTGTMSSTSAATLEMPPPDLPTSTATTSLTSDTSTTTTTTGAPTAGEWRGTYTTGFGFARFHACGERDTWALADDSLPYFNECPKEPLWLHILGTTMKDGNSTYLSVDTIIEGPCTVGGCMETDLLQECSDFETLCGG